MTVASKDDWMDIWMVSWKVEKKAVLVYCWVVYWVVNLDNAMAAVWADKTVAQTALTKADEMVCSLVDEWADLKAVLMDTYLADLLDRTTVERKDSEMALIWAAYLGEMMVEKSAVLLDEYLGLTLD